jgi:hypothetical protein
MPNSYVISKTLKWKQSKCLPTDEWVSCTMEYYSAIKMKETSVAAATLRDNDSMLSERSQTQIQKHHVNPHLSFSHFTSQVLSHQNYYSTSKNLFHSSTSDSVWSLEWDRRSRLQHLHSTPVLSLRLVLRVYFACRVHTNELFFRLHYHSH